jgi:superfamily II DNA helicase RecQ
VPCIVAGLSSADEGKFMIIVDPINALIRDQWYKLSKSGFNVHRLNSQISTAERTQMFCDLDAKKAQIIITTAESFFGEDGRKLWESRPEGYSSRLHMIVLDEAHTLVEMGESGFRPKMQDYKNLSVALPSVRMVALSGSFTDEVINYIRENVLNPQIAYVLYSSLERKNICLRLELCPGTILDLDTNLSPTIPLIREEVANGHLTMVFVQKRSVGVDVYDWYCRKFPELKDKIGIIHGNFTDPFKDDTMQKLLDKKLAIFVSTTAAGMGIDVPNVYKVIHLGIPPNIGDYGQEFGRAGRDGQPAVSVAITHARTISDAQKKATSRAKAASERAHSTPSHTPSQTKKFTKKGQKKYGHAEVFAPGLPVLNGAVDAINENNRNHDKFCIRQNLSKFRAQVPLTGKLDMLVRFEANAQVVASDLCCNVKPGGSVHPHVTYAGVVLFAHMLSLSRCLTKRVEESDEKRSGREVEEIIRGVEVLRRHVQGPHCTG